MSTARQVHDGEHVHEVREEAGLRWVEREGVWRARGDSGLYEVRHARGRFHAVWLGNDGNQVPLGERDSLPAAFGAARRFDPGTGRVAAETSSGCACEDCIGIHTHRDARPVAAREDAKFERCVKDVKAKGGARNPWAVCRAALGEETAERARYVLYGVDDTFDSFGSRGLDRFVKLNEFEQTDPELAAALRGLRPGEAILGGGGAQPEWTLAHLRPGEHEQTIRDRLRQERYDRADRLERQLGGASETRLTYEERKKLPASAFALPKRRQLPLTNARGELDAKHVDNAAARLSMMDHEGEVTKAEFQSATRKIAEARKRLGLGPTSLAAGEGLAVTQRDQAAVARGQKVGPLTNAKAIYEFTRTELLKSSQEMFVVVPLDIHGHPLNDKPYLVAMGQRSRVTVDESDVLRPVGDTNAAGFCVAHQHPSGSLRPSEADRALTKRIRESAKTAYPKVVFLDHILVTQGGYYSFAEDKAYKVKS